MLVEIEIHDSRIKWLKNQRSFMLTWHDFKLGDISVQSITFKIHNNKTNKEALFQYDERTDIGEDSIWKYTSNAENLSLLMVSKNSNHWKALS